MALWRRRVCLLFRCAGSCDSVLRDRGWGRPQLLKPERNRGVARHAEVASGREADRTHLRAIGERRSLVLAGEESLEELPEPAAEFLSRVARREFRLLGQEQ